MLASSFSLLCLVLIHVYQVGMGKAEVIIPITLLLVKELVVKGSFRYGVSLYQIWLYCF